MLLRSRHRMTLLTVLAALGGCGDDASGPVPASPRVVTIAPPAGELYQGDAITMSAVVRDGSGAEIPDAPIAWSVSDPTVVEHEGDGVFLLLKPGAVVVTARSGAAQASYPLDVKRLSVLQVTVGPQPLRLARGDVVLLGVHVRGEGGRTVTGRLVTLAIDDPSVAILDASGRVRAVATGTTTVRATADGVTGTTQVEVVAGEVNFTLSQVDGSGVPIILFADTVTWNGLREYHEVQLSTGRLVLSGGSQPRYEVELRYEQYHVTGPQGNRTRTLRMTSREYDRGIVEYDARGDLQMTSEYIFPLNHTALSVAGGMDMRFRIPGDTAVLNLHFRRN